jgi:hypothetical protein
VNPKQRRSNILGEYAPDRFMITLGQDAAFIDPSTLVPLPLDNDRVSILFHEYVHYLQNIATAAGYHSFRRALDGWRLFRETVGTDGSCAGSASLPPERAEWVAQYLAIGDMFDGDVDVDLPDTFVVDSFDIDEVNAVPVAMPIGTLTAHVTTVTFRGTARDPKGATEPYEYHFGTVAVMEGVAYELDQIVARGASGKGTPKYPSPPFPYHVLRKLITHHFPNADTRSVLRMGCLALMSNDPAGAISDLCRIAVEKLARGASLEEAIDQVDATQIHDLNDAIRSVDIPDHEHAFQGGTLGKGIAYVHGLFKEHLAARKYEPCLELAAVRSDERVDFDGVRKLFERIRPCMVLQQGRGSDSKLGRDLLWVNGDHGFNVRDELAVLHCALHFMSSHLGQDCFVESADAESSACPFYTCCSLPLRTKSPGICKRRPWKSFSWHGWPTTERCWYASAVASSAKDPGTP